MRRRTFINYIGSAIIGTAIALRLPDTIAPLNHLLEPPAITYQALAEAYEKACQGPDSPALMFLNPKTHRAARAMFEPSWIRTTFHVPGDSRTYDKGFVFRGAVVVGDDSLAENQINTHNAFGRQGAYYFA